MSRFQRRRCYRHGCDTQATAVLRWKRYSVFGVDLACGLHARQSVGPWVQITPYVN